MSFATWGRPARFSLGLAAGGVVSGFGAWLKYAITKKRLETSRTQAEANYNLAVLHQQAADAQKFADARDWLDNAITTLTPTTDIVVTTIIGGVVAGATAAFPRTGGRS